MLFNTIKIMAPNADYSIAGVPDFPDQKHIFPWAVETTKYMSKLGIIKGDLQGNFMPRLKLIQIYKKIMEVTKMNNFQSQESIPETFEQADVEKNKTMAGLAYIIFFLPLVACPSSRYARFHANQALLLFIVAVAGNIVLGIIPIFGWILMPFFWLAVFVLAIIGLINGFGGKVKRLPVVGKYNILN